MKKFNCKYCKYLADNLSNFKAHLKTKKHINFCKSLNVENPNLSINECTIIYHECEKCNKSFQHKMQLWRHSKKCSNTVDQLSNSSENIVSALVEQNKLLEKHTQLLEKQLEHQRIQSVEKQLADQNEILKGVIQIAVKNAEATTESAKATSKSISMLKYANTNLTKGKPLERLEYSGACEMIGHKNPPDKISYKEHKECAEMCISKHNDNMFAEYVGDIILEKYKKKKKNDTNIITTDVSRLSMIVLQKVDKDVNENEKEWINDKSGKRFIAFILEPLLDAIHKSLTEYIDVVNNTYHKYDNQDVLFSRMHVATIIKVNIERKKYLTPILKYVAPSFHFDAFDNNKQKQLEFCK